MMKSKIGPVTAYADAVQAGYTGTREEFGRQQADFAKNAASVEQAKTEVNQAIESFGQTANAAKQDVISEGNNQIKRIEDAAPDLEIDREQIKKNTQDIAKKITNPPNGTAGQVLTKTENSEEWRDPVAGNVPKKLSDLESDSDHRTVTDTEKDSWNGKYNKPESGIPASDLADGVMPDVSKKLTQPETVTVGQILKVKSVNDDGTIVLEAVDMTSGGVDDVQIGGTSIVDGGVANIPYPEFNGYGEGAQIAGVMTDTTDQFVCGKIGNSFTNGVPVLKRVTLNDVRNAVAINSSNRHNCVPAYYIKYFVKSTLTNYLDADWADSEKILAQETIGIRIIKTAMDEVAVAGAHYYLPEQTELTITLPDDALPGQEITVVWYNGETPATLAVAGNMLDFDYAPGANTRSEISCLWDGTYWSLISNEQSVPTTTEEVVASE